MRKSKPYKILKNITISEVGAEGKCVSKHEEKVIFSEYVAPGDEVDLQIVKSKKNYSEGKAIFFHKLSPLRTEPFCEHFGTCGGCKWQHIQYDLQASSKEKQVNDALQRIAKVDFPTIKPILKAPAHKFYRNKLEYTFSSKRWLTKEEIESGADFDKNALGFHIPGRFDKILDISNCYLQEEPSNSIRLKVKEYAEKHNLDFFDIKSQEGFLRILIIRTSSTGDVMVILQVYYEDKPAIKGLMEFLKSEFPQITSLNYVVNPKGNETFNDLEVINYHGLPYIEEKMEDLTFKIGPKSFYQTNSVQAYTLYKATRDLAGLTGNEVVYDLYTGTGTIANFIAKSAKKVVGIEYVEMAIEDAKKNSQNNNINNTLFYAGDMKDVLTPSFVSEHGKPDVIITDPPRAGMHADVVKTILEIEAKKIVYVSCNPASQARDLALMDEKYSIKAVQPVDMFPQTHHVENIVLLELK